ncbi:MAG: hypothetical protein ABI286_11280 [Edaphobacter sp.]
MRPHPPCTGEKIWGFGYKGGLLPGGEFEDSAAVWSVVIPAPFFASGGTPPPLPGGKPFRFIDLR